MCGCPLHYPILPHNSGDASELQLDHLSHYESILNMAGRKETSLSIFKFHHNSAGLHACCVLDQELLYSYIQVWKGPEENLWDLIISFHHVSSKDLTRVVRLYTASMSTHWAVSAAQNLND